MLSGNKKSVTIDLGAILEGLLQADIDFILVGGLAAVVQGAPVTTLDVDIVYKQSTENISGLIAFLKSTDAIYRRPDDKIITPNADDLEAKGHFLFSTRFGPLDLLTFIEGEKVYEDLLERTVEIEFRSYKIKVLNLKTLVELKQKSQHPKDKQKLAILEETLRQVEKD